MVLHLDELHTSRQRSFNVLCAGLQCFAQLNDVATFGHGHTQANHLFAVVTHFDGGRVNVILFDGAQVRQFDLLTRGTANGHLPQGLEAVELAIDAQLNGIFGQVQCTRRFNRVLLPQLRNDGAHVDAHCCQFLLRNFNEYFFVLHAKQFHLGNVLNTQDFLTHIVCKLFHLRWRKAICLKCINDAINITKIVDKEWPHHTRGQSAAHVADFLAYGVPNIGHFGWLGIVFDLENDLRFTRLGIAANLVSIGHFLKRSLQFVCDLFCHLLRCGTRPIGANHHDAEGERWIFILT